MHSSELERLLDEYEISVLRIEETLNSREKKYEKLEILTDDLKRTFRSIRKTHPFAHVSEELKIEKILRDIEYDRNWKDKRLDEISETTSGNYGLSFLFGYLGPFLGVVAWAYYSISGSRIAFFVGAGLMTFPVVFPLGTYVLDWYQRNSCLRRYEKKIVKNCEELVENSKAFMKYLKEKVRPEGKRKRLSFVYYP
jgi:hypothetical protein